MNVKHFMTREPYACEVDDSVADVAREMRDTGVGYVVVLDDGRVAGVVTDRDLAIRAMAEDLPSTTPIANVMTRNPSLATMDDNLVTVIHKMRGAGVVRRLPVVDAERRLLGVVSLADISVLARDIIDAVLLEEERHALSEAHVASGGKLLQKEIRGGGHEVAEGPLRAVTRTSVPTSAVRAGFRRS